MYAVTWYTFVIKYSLIHKLERHSNSCRTRCSMKVEFSWNVMAHGDAREGKSRGNWRMEWVASTPHTTSEHGVSRITTAMRTRRLPAVEWTDAPADLNGLVRFAKRRNLISARVPSHFRRSLLQVGPATLHLTIANAICHSRREEHAVTSRCWAHARGHNATCCACCVVAVV